MQTSNVIRIARKHLGKGVMESSARICMADAIQQFDAGNFDAAKMWALKSIKYCVGVFHDDYKKAAG